MSGLTKAAIVAAAAIVVTGVAGCSSGSNAGAKTSAAPVQLTAATTGAGTTTAGPTIDVAGHGEVSGTPDVMTVTLGVQTTDPSAQAALQRNNDRAAQLIAALKARGVADKDIQTIDLNVSPNFDKDYKVTGYSASNTVSAKLRDLSKAGEVIDAAALTVGPDVRLQGVTFSIDNTSALVAKARADAVKDALAQGGQLAAAAGVKLGAIRTIDDTGTQLPQPEYYDKASSGSAAGVPISPGTQQLSVDVTVVFDIAG